MLKSILKQKESDYIQIQFIVQNYCCVTAAVTDRHSKRLQNRFNLIHFCYSYIKFMLIKTGLLVLVLQSKQMVALRPPPVADKGSNALSEITSNRKHIYVQRIATVFQTVNLKIKSVDESQGYAPQAVGEAELFASNNPRHPLH